MNSLASTSSSIPVGDEGTNIGNDSRVSTLVFRLEESLCVDPECVELPLEDTFDLAALAANLPLFLRILPVDAIRIAGRPIIVFGGGGNGSAAVVS